MSKILIFFLALSLLVVFAQCKYGRDNYDDDDEQDGDWDTDESGDESGDDDGDDGDDGDSDDDDDGDDGWHYIPSGWLLNRKQFNHHRVPNRFSYTFTQNNNGRTDIYLQNCLVSNCMNCKKLNCRRCMPGFRLKRKTIRSGKISRCEPICPIGKQHANGRCQNNVCHDSPHCLKCQNFLWTRSCQRCEDGWYRYNGPNQRIARCVRACPRGYRSTNGTHAGPTCEKIPSFCFNAPHCVKCAKFPWTRSCIKCEDGWYRYKAPYQKIANCVKVCPRGYRANAGTRNVGPTCGKIPSFCFNAPHCVTCAKFPWTRSCIKCEDGWYRYKAPYQMIANCFKVCPRGYQANAGTRNVGPTCEKIPSFCHNAPHCLKCANFPWTRSCIKCEDGWYRYKAPYTMISNCVKVCPRGYQATNGPHISGAACEKIPSFCHQLRNCEKCPGWPRSCKRCEEGWYRYKPLSHNSARCIRRCPRGYRAANGSRKFGPTCKKIKSFCFRLRHCKVCTENFPLPRSCKRCKDGWYRYMAPHRLTAKCIKTCPRGYQATNGTSDTGPTCEEIQSFCHDIPNCRECPGPIGLSICDRCEEGWYRYKDPPHQMSTTCVQDCSPGFRATNGTDLLGPSCEKVKTRCSSMPGCEVCPKSNICLQCKANMTLFEGLFESECVYKCPKGFDQSIKDGISTCVAQKGCLDKMCFLCKKGWYKLNRQERVCHRECPSGYFKYPGNCIRCTKGCRKCNSVFQCDLCADGMAKLTSRLGFGERCVLNCPRGYTKELVNNTYYECHKICRDKNCENCESVSYHGPYHCDFCKPTFHKLHRNLRDECVDTCPTGYVPEMDGIEGSVCRQDDNGTATSKPIPTTTEDRSTTSANMTTVALP